MGIDDVLRSWLPRMAATTHETTRGYKALRQRIEANEAPTAQAEGLSEIESVDQRILPPTYLNYYDRLRHSDPDKAEAFWEKWAFVPKSATQREAEARARLEADRIRKAGEALARVQSGNKLKRRI